LDILSPQNFGRKKFVVEKNFGREFCSVEKKIRSKKIPACNEMADPITGSQSGAWSCEDPEIFCGPIGDIPAFDDKKTVWTCDHNVHPYGDASKTIFQDTTCRTT
jgi:hypothetical protein